MELKAGKKKIKSRDIKSKSGRSSRREYKTGAKGEKGGRGLRRLIRHLALSQNRERKKRKGKEEEIKGCRKWDPTPFNTALPNPLIRATPTQKCAHFLAGKLQKSPTNPCLEGNPNYKFQILFVFSRTLLC